MKAFLSYFPALLLRWIGSRKIVLVLLCAWLLLSYNLDKPFIGHHDWNGAFWGTITRNYLRVIDSHVHPNQTTPSLIYFVNYPPLMPILFTFSASIFGLQEWSLRLVTVLCSLLLLYYIYQTGRLLYSEKTGLLASILAMLTPMFLYFGKLPDHEPIITVFIVAGVYHYLENIRSREQSWKPFLIWFGLAFLESWSAYFWIPILMLHHKFVAQAKSFPKGRLIGIALIALVLHLGYVIYFNGEAGIYKFLNSGLSRLNAGSVTGDIIRFTLKQYIATELRYAVIYFTRILLILSIVWVARLFWKWRKKENTKDDADLLVLGIPAVLFILIFNKLAYVHDYKLYVLLPFITLSAAVSAVSFLRGIERWVKKLSGNIFIKTAVLTAMFLLLICSVGLERLVYLQTLLRTSFNMPGYTLGKILNQTTRSDQKIFVNSLELMSFYDVFITYYSDRAVSGGDLTLDAYLAQPDVYQDFDFMVFVDGRTKDEHIAAYLKEHYSYQKYNDTTLIKLK